MFLQPLHILIADDDTDDQQLLADAVLAGSADNVMITISGNGADLLKFLETRAGVSDKDDNLPDVILLDINMPFTDGLEALKLIKLNPRLRHILIFVITTMRNFEKLEECMDHGANGFYTKPNNHKGYTLIINEVLAATYAHLSVL